MNLQIIIMASITIALLGTMIGTAMVALDKQQFIENKRKEQEWISHEDALAQGYKPPPRKRLFLPMIICLGMSLALMIMGYKTGNIIGFSVGFLLLFIGFGLLGAFLNGR